MRTVHPGIPLRTERHPELSPPILYPIAWPKPKQPVRGVCLASAVEGVLVHYDHAQGRTSACWGRENDCPGCGPFASTRWQFYIPCLGLVKGRIFIAQVTKEAKRCCPEMNMLDFDLRGMILYVERVGEKANGRVTACVRRDEAERRLPEAPPIMPSLLQLWGIAEGGAA